MKEVPCIICGCTESRACEDGCSWALMDPPVCDRCIENPFMLVPDGDSTLWLTPPGPTPARSAVPFADKAEAEATAKDLNAAHAMGVATGLAIAASIVLAEATRRPWTAKRPAPGHAVFYNSIAIAISGRRKRRQLTGLMRVKI
jgi:hypothetical protein